VDSSLIPAGMHLFLWIPVSFLRILVDSGLIPVDSGHSCRNLRGSEKYRFEGPVQSGFFAILGRTAAGTGHGPVETALLMKQSKTVENGFL
jgi:hypothetical protein